MTETQFKKFTELKEEFKKKIEEWKAKYPEHKDDFVYNTALDRIAEKDKIKFIIVGDNPGKDEKAKGEYFIGKAGQLCRKFFKETFGFSFNKTVIALNKTPISTAKTLDLTDETKFSKEMVAETQRWMAAFTVNICEIFELSPYIIGSSLFAPGKLFETFAKSLEENLYRIDYHRKYFHPMVFKHFSHGHFMRDWMRSIEWYKQYDFPIYGNRPTKFPLEVDTVDSEEEDDTQVIEPERFPDKNEAKYFNVEAELNYLGRVNYSATIGKYYPIEIKEIAEMKINENGEVECYNLEGQLMTPNPIKSIWQKFKAISVEKGEFQMDFSEKDKKTGAFKVLYEMEKERLGAIFDNTGWTRNSIAHFEKYVKP